ncbi:MAG: molybdate ABC transporter substrate-binding protein [Caulobacterales bacterium 68-7]|nr:MAG: molybdate ABC transporter substrate-binding protein [Caulobacterales bacterium 68-7]
MSLAAVSRRWALVVALVLSAALPLAGPVAARAPVTVLAAASLKDVMDAQAAAFRQSTGNEVRLSYAASSALARQVEAGAPADIFMSADSDWMDYVQQRNLLKPGTRRDLLTNRLALIAPARSTVRLTVGRNMPLARALGGGRLAMAAPEVPAGRYGRAALTSLGVWSSVEGRVASADNVRAALAYVSRGETPLGVVYDTDAKADPGVRIVGLFPPGSHPPIVYPAAVLARSEEPVAQRFLDYLGTPAAEAVFRMYGFTVLRARR